MKSIIGAVLLSLSLGLSAAASANGRMVTVEVANLTNATYFTPILVAVHNRDFHLFQIGTPASDSLQAMAEGGELAGLIDEANDAGGNHAILEDDLHPAGLLAPGVSVAAELEMGRHSRYLSLTGMLLPTNDGFLGLDAMRIPQWPGVYTYYVNGYDAGTEVNNELINGGGAPGVLGIPADPGGNAGTGGSGLEGPDHNTNVHIHRGVVGDLDPAGGPSDLAADVHRWLNPVAKVTVTVGRRGRY